MSSLVLGMIRTRRRQAVVLALQASLAMVTTTAAPTYLHTSDAAIAAGQVLTSSNADRTVSIRALQDVREPGSVSAARMASTLAPMAGFQFTYGEEFSTIGIESSDKYRSRLVYRQDVCAHLIVVAGRCLVSEGDVLLGAGSARRMGIEAGEPITLTFARFNNIDKYVTSGISKRLTVAGIYHVSDRSEAYWADHNYFTPDITERAGEPVFTNAATIATMDHGQTLTSLDGTASQQVLEIGKTELVRDRLRRLEDEGQLVGAAIIVKSQIPDLLDRIDDGRAAAELIVPVLAVPLVLLAGLSMFQSIRYSMDARRSELEIIGLRGPPWWIRWWLKIGESLVVVVVGAAFGCVAGQLLVEAIAAFLFPTVSSDLSWSSLRFVPYGLVVLLLSVLAARSPISNASTARRLRVPRYARALAAEIAAALLGLIAYGQVVASGGDVSGVGTFAAALLMLSTAFLGARVAIKIIQRQAASALRRGRLVTSLAGLNLTRRPGAATILALLATAFAVCGYAAAALTTAAQLRTQQASVGVGAFRVITVAPVTRHALLSTVRTIDPRGRFAMAVSVLPSQGPNAPNGLAVDTSRLATVSYWSTGEPDPRMVADLLHPKTEEPVVAPGPQFAVGVSARNLTKEKPIRLVALLSSSLGDALVPLGDLSNGTSVYQQRVPVCLRGCRLNGLQFSTVEGLTGITGAITINSIGSTDPDRISLGDQ